jgi:hypothetical protein
LLQRDIVQFVPYNRYGQHVAMLAKETLAEVPGQFLSFMKSKNIRPGAARKAADPSFPMASATVEIESPASVTTASSMGSPSAGAYDEAPPAFGDLMAPVSHTVSNGPPMYDAFAK